MDLKAFIPRFIPLSQGFHGAVQFLTHRAAFLGCSQAVCSCSGVTFPDHLQTCAPNPGSRTSPGSCVLLQFLEPCLWMGEAAFVPWALWCWQQLPQEQGLLILPLITALMNFAACTHSLTGAKPGLCPFVPFIHPCPPFWPHHKHLHPSFSSPHLPFTGSLPPKCQHFTKLESLIHTVAMPVLSSSIS